MGLMFGKIIPMNVLAQMPLPFVHRLRDIRIKQIEEANRQQELQLQQAQNRQKSRTAPQPTQQTTGWGADPAMFNGTPYDDLIDELT